MPAQIGGRIVRPLRSEDAAEVAVLARLVRARACDFVDPFPPCTEGEVLADAAARKKSAAVRPRVVVEGGAVEGYGAVDYSGDTREAQLVGPVVDPERRRGGRGTSLLVELLGRARAERQRRVRASVGAANEAGRAFLVAAGFEEVGRNVVLRIGRAESVPALPLEGVFFAHSSYEHASEVHAYTRRFLPRTEKQTQSLLKSHGYEILLAHQQGRVVGFAEVDARFGEVATLEAVDGDGTLLNAGLGAALVAEALRAAFAHARIQAVDLLVPAGDERLETYLECGFTKRGELVVFGRSL
jgi:ribosomal protein S18 acetylase RimI-like enzyme